MPIAALAATLLYASCKSGEPVNLKLNLQAGSQYLYTMDTKMTMQQSVMGQSMSSQQDMTMESVYDVTAAEGNDKRITVTYDRVAVNMKSPAMSMAYDSKDSASSDPRMAMMGNMLHKPFTMDVSDRGEIKNITGLDAIINAMGDTTTAEGAQMRAQMESIFNDTAIRSTMQQSLNFFPDHPIKPGDTWKKTYAMKVGMMSMSVDNEFKLTSVTGNTAHIDLTGTIKGGGSGSAETQNVNINLTGTQKGNMDVDVPTGLVTDSKIRQDIKGEMSAMGMKVPMTITQDIHLAAKKK